MAGSKKGGKKAAATNIKRHGKDYYKRLGKMGGANSGTGGFYHSMVNGLDWHREAGKKGGKISRRPPHNATS